MNDWITDLNTGELDSRYIEIMNVVNDVEKTIPEKDKERFYQDLRDTFENRRKTYQPRKKWWNIF